MEVVDRKPIPIYEVECIECKSKIQYKRSEICHCHITCPVCGVALWAEHILPVKYEEDKGWTEYQKRNARYDNAEATKNEMKKISEMEMYYAESLND